MARTSANPLWNPWANDRKLLDLYRERCRQEAEEMTCAAQAAKILEPLITPGETLLDVGCGGGYYYWSFQKRNIQVCYQGLDYTPEMIELARSEMIIPTDLKKTDFILAAIEDLDRGYDNILCFNVLTNNPHYALPLERMLCCCRKRILIRESFGKELKVTFQPDYNIDEDKRDLRVYHNTYPMNETIEFIKSYGFEVKTIIDERTKDGMEMVCDIPHYWRILMAERKIN
jgi:SAM-dependent methyltransferase